MEEAHKKALEYLHAEAEADQEELRSKYEKELERGLEEAVTEAREQWSQVSINVVIITIIILYSTRIYQQGTQGT